MALWTDIIDPATLTGYARAALADYEASKGTLARWLPNRFVPSTAARPAHTVNPSTSAAHAAHTSIRGSAAKPSRASAAVVGPGAAMASPRSRCSARPSTPTAAI